MSSPPSPVCSKVSRPFIGCLRPYDCSLIHLKLKSSGSTPKQFWRRWITWISHMTEKLVPYSLFPVPYSIGNQETIVPSSIKKDQKSSPMCSTMNLDSTGRRHQTKVHFLIHRELETGKRLNDFHIPITYSICHCSNSSHHIILTKYTVDQLGNSVAMFTRDDFLEMKSQKKPWNKLNHVMSSVDTDWKCFLKNTIQFDSVL
jgi:hypothetical protein